MQASALPNREFSAVYLAFWEFVIDFFADQSEADTAKRNPQIPLCICNLLPSSSWHCCLIIEYKTGKESDVIPSITN